MENFLTFLYFFSPIFFFLNSALWYYKFIEYFLQFSRNQKLQFLVLELSGTGGIRQKLFVFICPRYFQSGWDQVNRLAIPEPRYYWFLAIGLLLCWSVLMRYLVEMCIYFQHSDFKIEVEYTAAPWCYRCFSFLMKQPAVPAHHRRKRSPYHQRTPTEIYLRKILRFFP